MLLHYCEPTDGLGDLCSTGCLDWEQDTLEDCRQNKALPPACDLIVAADCVYDPGLATALARMLALLLSDALYPRARVLVANTVRQQQSLDAFAAGLRAGGLVWAPLLGDAASGVATAAEFGARVPQVFAYERPAELVVWSCARCFT